jgi:hypothetical protein
VCGVPIVQIPPGMLHTADHRLSILLQTRHRQALGAGESQEPLGRGGWGPGSWQQVREPQKGELEQQE